MTRKFKVSFEAETDDQGFTHAPHETTRQYADGIDGFLIGVPIDAEITEIKPEFEAGWYQYYDETTLNSEVSFWTLDEIEGVFNFDRNYRRMNPPTPYEESKYKDGYYEMSDGYEYRREGGLWYLRLSSGWQSSGYSDNDIDSDYDIQWVRAL